MTTRALPILALALPLLVIVACGTAADVPDSGTSDGGASPTNDAATIARDSSTADDADASSEDASSVDAADAAGRERTCETEATLRFENCASSATDAGLPPIAQVIVASRISPGVNGPAACAVADQSWVAIGAYGVGGGAHRPVRNGDNEAGDRVDVSCSVIPGADGSYRLRAEATRANAGSVRISGIFRPENAPQTGITVTFERPDLGTFTQADCVARYDVNPAAGIASGRAWFGVKCAHAASAATL